MGGWNLPITNQTIAFHRLGRPFEIVYNRIAELHPGWLDGGASRASIGTIVAILCRLNFYRLTAHAVFDLEGFEDAYYHFTRRAATSINRAAGSSFKAPNNKINRPSPILLSSLYRLRQCCRRVFYTISDAVQNAITNSPQHLDYEYPISCHANYGYWKGAVAIAFEIQRDPCERVLLFIRFVDVHGSMAAPIASDVSLCLPF